MHRCLLPHALPARARCVPNFLALNRPSPSRWRPTFFGRCYNTAVADSRGDEPHGILKSDALGSYVDTTTPLDPPSDPVDEQQADRDALDFILDGYETKHAPVARVTAKKERIAGSFASYDAHIRTPKTQTGAGQKPLGRKARGYKLGGSQQTQYRVQVTRDSRLEHALRKAPRAPTLWGRPRYVSVAIMGQYSPYALNRVWNHNYARAQNVFDKHQSSDTRMKGPPLLDPRAAEWVDSVITQMDDKQSPNLKDLASKNDMEQSNVWAHVALWMLHYDKDCLVEFLVTTSNSFSPGPWVADCLQVLAAHYIQSKTADTVQYVAKLNQIFCALSENPSGKGISFDGRFVRLVLPHSTTAQMVDIHRAIKVGEFRVHANTLMHLTSYFAKHDHFHQALDVLLDAHRGGANIRRYPFRSNCSTLLRKSMSLPGGLRICLRIVDNLAKIGVVLNTRLCNIIILNAVEAGDGKTAFDIYQSLLENEVKPDKYTHALLLKACKLNIDDAEVLNNTITNAIESGSLSESPVVAVEILHCLALHHTRNSGADAWPTICQAYAQIYELDPLVKLGLPVPSSVQSTQTARKPLRVPSQAIDIMLRAYCQLTADGHGSIARVQTMYQRYRLLVAERAEPFAATAFNTHCYNAFLGAFIKSKRTLINAADVIKDMQNAAAESPPTSVLPDVQTWSIFLEGFTRHGQLKLAEQVLTYMRGKGLEPNAVTWNALLTGYAGEQEFDGLLNALNRFDESGHVWDEWTYGGLRRFRNSEQLKDALQQRGKEVQLDFTSDLKDGIGARLSDVSL